MVVALSPPITAPMVARIKSVDNAVLARAAVNHRND
jgi:hypothetical protein